MKTFTRSKYNFFVKNKKGEWVCFNGMSNALAKISDAEYQDVLAILGNPQDEKYFGDLRESLIQGRFLIPEGSDEISLLKSRDRLSRFGTNKLGLLIAVTEQCNFRCVYCYENQLNRKMTQETMERLLRYLAKESEKKRSIHITWFGGEPLLAWKEIEFLTGEILKICKKNKCFYEAAMITNGYLLTEEKVKQFRKLKITGIQVTVDGTAPIHNQRKPLVNGGPTYDKIINNLKRIPRNISVMLRINVDKTNLANIKDFFGEISMFKDRKNFDFSVHTVDPSGIKNEEHIKNCLTLQEFADVVFETIDYARSLGFRIPLNPRTVKSSRCMAVCYNDWIVNSEGALYKCYLDLGDERKAVGKIKADGTLETDFNELSKWIGYDVFTSEKCLNCRILPLCLGGCENRRQVNRLNEPDSGCVLLKLGVEEYLMRC